MNKNNFVNLQKQLHEDSEKLLIASIEARLKLTYEERIEAHENAKLLFEELKKVGEQLRAEPKTAS